MFEQHEAIVDAIEKRDGNRAQDSLWEHLQSTGEKLIAAILEIESEN